MYFVGFKKTWGSNCIGVATSRSPDTGFVATDTTICASQRGSEAIDPGAYRAFDGKRYLFFKTCAGFRRDVHIQRIRMDSAHGVRPVPNTRTTVINAHSPLMEAPSLFRHGGRLWLFVSRGNFANCGYSTQAWAARNIAGAFRPVRYVMTTASSGFCGPGGASVLRSGDTTWIAFHSWVDRSGSPVRAAWVDRLAWNAAGQPYLS